MMACSNVEGHRVLGAVDSTRLSDAFDQIFFLCRRDLQPLGRDLQS